MSELQPINRTHLQNIQQLNTILHQFIDLDRFPPEFIIHWMGQAVMSLMNDESFKSNPDNEEAAAMLMQLCSGNFKLVQCLSHEEEA